MRESGVEAGSLWGRETREHVGKGGNGCFGGGTTKQHDATANVPTSAARHGTPPNQSLTCVSLSAGQATFEKWHSVIIVVLIFRTIYTFLWDIGMDWAFLRGGSLLRPMYVVRRLGTWHEKTGRP